MISANVTTGQSLYWMAGNEFFKGNSLVKHYYFVYVHTLYTVLLSWFWKISAKLFSCQVGAYGGDLTYVQKVSSLPNGTVEERPHIVLKVRIAVIIWISHNFPSDWLACMIYFSMDYGNFKRPIRIKVPYFQLLYGESNFYKTCFSLFLVLFYVIKEMVCGFVCSIMLWMYLEG